MVIFHTHASLPEGTHNQNPTLTVRTQKSPAGSSAAAGESARRFALGRWRIGCKLGPRVSQAKWKVGTECFLPQVECWLCGQTNLEIHTEKTGDFTRGMGDLVKNFGYVIKKSGRTHPNHDLSQNHSTGCRQKLLAHLLENPGTWPRTAESIDYLISGSPNGKSSL